SLAPHREPSVNWYPCRLRLSRCQRIILPIRSVSHPYSIIGGVMARLSLALLGPLEVRLDGQPVTALAYDKVWALLAYLAIEADRPPRRDALIGLLWPDQPNQAARTNLRQALTQLRQALGDHAAQPPFLLIARETIQFNLASDYDLDVTAFD